MARAPHGAFDQIVWLLAAWIYSSAEDVSPWRCSGFRLGMLAAAAILTAVALRHGAFPLLWHQIGAALWLVASLIMMRGERTWGDPRLGWAAGAGLFAMIGFIAWLAILRA